MVRTTLTLSKPIEKVLKVYNAQTKSSMRSQSLVVKVWSILFSNQGQSAVLFPVMANIYSRILLLSFHVDRYNPTSFSLNTKANMGWITISIMEKYLDYLWLVGIITLLTGMLLSPGDHAWIGFIAYMIAALISLAVIVRGVMKIPNMRPLWSSTQSGNCPYHSGWSAPWKSPYHRSSAWRSINRSPFHYNQTEDGYGVFQRGVAYLSQQDQCKIGVYLSRGQQRCHLFNHLSNGLG